jgi:hypothetical protein
MADVQAVKEFHMGQRDLGCVSRSNKMEEKLC